MKFIVQKSILLDALTLTGKCIGKNILTIMESYLFKIENNKLIVIGSNLEVTMEKQLDIESEVTARITLPAGRLFGLIKELPEQPLEFNIIGYGTGLDESITVEIKAASGTYVIPATNGNDYSLQDNKSEIAFTIESEKLLEGINKTIFACGTDALRPALAGVSLSFADGKVTFTGTNANVLSTYSYEVKVDTAYNFVIPAKVLHILAGMVPNTVIGVNVDVKSIVFHVNNTTILKSRLIDEKFPDYKAIIPKTNDKQLTVNRPDLISSLNRVTQFCDDTQNTVRLEIGPDKIELSSENSIGELAHETMLNTYDGEPTAVRFNGRNLIGCLKNIGSDEVNLSFLSPKKAFLLRTTTEEAEELTNLMLLMPLVD
jgi:DNA polymerase-3 subunit beta